MRRSVAHGFVLVLLAAVGLAAPAGAAESIALTEAQSAGFPERAYVLSLSQQRSLRAGDVHLTENAQPVRDLRVKSGGQSGIVLAIDTSESMHGAAIDGAMAAAREFVRQRRVDQKIGVVFFSREPKVALEPTTDVEAISRTLATPPELSKGTRVYDATTTAIDVLNKAAVPAGSVIVLSDGADVGSQASAASVAQLARRDRVRVFSIGLRSSSSYTARTLQDIVTPGGTYTETTSSASLEGIFSQLGSRLAKEFVLTYRSELPLESRVVVAVTVDGISGVATSAYQTPAFPSVSAINKVESSAWRSTGMLAAVILSIALLLALALWSLLRPSKRSVSSRITAFSESVRPARSLFDLREHAGGDARERWLERFGPWQAFELDVELAKLRWSPMRIVFGGLAGGVAIAAIAHFVFDATVVAVLALVVTPVATRFAVKHLATRVRRRFEDQLPDNLQVMASGLRAGHSFVGGLTVMVNDAPEPSRTEYRRVLHDEQLGIPIESSLNVVAERMKCDDVVYIGLIATLQRETGGNTAEVLDKVVETMRERGKIRRLVRTLTAQGRLGGWIVTCLPIAMIVFLNVFKPDYLEPMTKRFVGWVILGVAACMVALGAYCIRRIVDIKV